MQLISIWKQSSVVLLSALLMACGKYTILLPTENAEYLNEVPDAFVVQYDTQAPSKITLNGVDITDHFTMSGTEARASGADVDGYLLEGNNILAVKTGMGATRSFFYDSEGPSVINREVATLGSQVNIKGYLKDASADRGPMTLRLNNNLVSLDASGNFDVTVNKAQQYRFEATDVHGHDATTIIADRGTMVDNMIAFEVTESAINDFLPVFQEIIEEVDLSQGAPIALFREYIGINLPKACAPLIGWPCVGPINFDILEAEVSLTGGKVEELTFSDIDLKSGYLPLRGYWDGFSFDVVAENGYVAGEAKLNVLGLSDSIMTLLGWFGLEDKLSFMAGIFRLSLPIDRLHLAATLGIEAENGDLNATLVSLDDLGMGAWDAGDLNLEVPQAIRDFGFGLTAALLDVVFSGIEAVRDLILDIIGKIVAPTVGNIFIDLFLKEVPQIHVGVGFDNGALFSALLATDRINIEVAQSGVSADDRLLVTMDGRIGSEAAGDDPNAGLGFGAPAENFIDQYFSDHFFPDGGSVPAELGPTPGIAPEALGFRFTETALPDPESNQELAVTISSNLVNQALLGVYEGGLTTVRMPLQASSQSVYLTTIEDANLLLKLEPTTPSEVVFRGTKNAVAYLRITDFSVSVDELKDGQWQTRWQTVLSADVPVQFSTDSGDGLSLALLTPSIDLAVGTGGTLEKVIVQTVFLDVLMGQINSALVKIQLPEDIQLKVDAAGIEINPGKVSLVGQPREHLSFESNFNAL
jgi:hypothetical protein